MDIADTPPNQELAAVRTLLAGPSRQLGEASARAALTPLGLPFVRQIAAHSAGEAVQGAAAIGFPVALKIASDAILHKTDGGFVQLNLQSAEAVAAAFEDIWNRARHGGLAADGVVVQEMAPPGIDLFIGSSRHVFWSMSFKS